MRAQIFSMGVSPGIGTVSRPIPQTALYVKSDRISKLDLMVPSASPLSSVRASMSPEKPTSSAPFIDLKTLVNNDDLENALPIFKEVFTKNENWKTLTPRLLPTGLLKVNEEQLEKILSVK